MTARRPGGRAAASRITPVVIGDVEMFAWQGRVFETRDEAEEYRDGDAVTEVTSIGTVLHVWRGHGFPTRSAAEGYRDRAHAANRATLRLQLGADDLGEG